MANITLRRPWRSPLAPIMERDRDFFGPSLRRMLDAMAESTFSTEPIGVMPAVEISETPDAFVCTTELPGITAKDVTVSFDDDMLTIKGEKREEREEKEGKKYHLVERSYGTFERSFTFPGKVDADTISANFADGVLTIRVPKTADGKPGGRTIKVQAS